MQSSASTNKKENGLLNILINVILPVLILNKLSDKLGPGLALGLALALPLIYGIYDFYRQRKLNMFSTLGFLNVLVTGSLALLKLGGIWFSIKEAAFPGLISIFVFVSAYTQNPFIKTLLLNPQVMDLDKIEARLAEKNSHSAFAKHLKFCTQLLSLSFVLSAVLNFVLAQRIFLPIDSTLDEAARSTALNQQIAQMTSAGFAVIMVPSIIFMIVILWILLTGVRKHTGLTTEEFVKG